MIWWLSMVGGWVIADALKKTAFDILRNSTSTTTPLEEKYIGSRLDTVIYKHCNKPASHVHHFPSQVLSLCHFCTFLHIWIERWRIAEHKGPRLSINYPSIFHFHHFSLAVSKNRRRREYIQEKRKKMLGLNLKRVTAQSGKNTMLVWILEVGCIPLSVWGQPKEEAPGLSLSLKLSKVFLPLVRWWWWK